MSDFKVLLAGQLVMMFLKVRGDLPHTFVRNAVSCEHLVDMFFIPMFERATYNITLVAEMSLLACLHNGDDGFSPIMAVIASVSGMTWTVSMVVR